MVTSSKRYAYLALIVLVCGFVVVWTTTHRTKSSGGESV